MNDLTTALLRCWITAHAALTAPRERDERGDVPGWVMITVMTATIVAGLISVAGPQLKQMLIDALNSVK